MVKTVYETFKELHDAGYIYRGNPHRQLVSLLPLSAFADIEVKYREQTDPLYYVKYGPLRAQPTVRPETKFGDTAIAVHPKTGAASTSLVPPSKPKTSMDPSSSTSLATTTSTRPLAPAP
ncbi:class I tRNA ligase family protein [bacterium]|nr:MAG: class I tRNA ligase family protein [bacterium]